ncbi:hypothetical protein POM88_038711 [Heracleum sosnowskyi]|uniref:Uncharacterized protein n=1 Tax=Heracleum sosnowskyi TaxID=360622 RepID=A0AAD8M5R6_9APIA|nr:hypothetical protein POM88_038711 [Heracleum sosnowskyi]
MQPPKSAPKNDVPNPVLVLSSNIVAPIIENCALRGPESVVLSKNLHMDRSEIAEQTPAPQTSPLKLDSVGTADVDVKVVPWVNDSSSFKHEQTSYKKIQNIQMKKQYPESLILLGLE